MNLKFKFLLACFMSLSTLTLVSGQNEIINSPDSNIQFEAVKLSPEEKQVISSSLAQLHTQYDPEIKMIQTRLNGYNYHTDALTGEFHRVRESINYAVRLLDLGDEQFTQRAWDLIDKTISLQDQDTMSKSCGVWPYYLEEPLATKKSPIDYNWADFNAVSLLDVWMGHQARIPETLKPKIKQALILAAKSIQKRNVGPGYTNIAIMGTYATYMVSHLFGLEAMKVYAQARLKRFYDYTLDKGGFSEYNSPTYTIIALDELYRMKQHINEPSAKLMIDSLYSTGWEIIARHYHQPTGQWAGPHSRSYSTLARQSFYAILRQGSNGKIAADVEEKRSDVKIKHQIPDHLLHYFLSPKYPRTETDIFEKNLPQIIGTSYLTPQFALSTANRSSFWNQRRPFLVYWGNVITSHYIQVRFLHDDYDFSSACFFSKQKENQVLAGINFIPNGGDKHISIDKLKDGKFMAKDLRLRFEFGNIANAETLTLPSTMNNPFSISIDNLTFNLQLNYAVFENLKGYWTKGGDGKNAWIDFIIYSGQETEFDLTMISKAAMSFVFSVEQSNTKFIKAETTEMDGLLKVQWNGLTLELPLKPEISKNGGF